MMEWSKRARTADWKSGVLTLDGENKFEIPELTMDLYCTTCSTGRRMLKASSRT